MQTNSSLKKFFPGDDDDMELASDDQHTSSSVGLVPDKAIHESNPSFHPTPRDVSIDHTGNRRSPLQISEKNVSQNGIPLRQDISPSPVVNPAADNAQQLKSPGIQGRVELDSHEFSEAPSIGAPGELYKIISQVGEGTFGKVYKAQNTVTKLYVALKRIRMESEKDGFPVTAMREIKLLQSLRHANIVQLYEMMVSNGEIIVSYCKCHFIASRLGLYGLRVYGS